MVQFQFILLSTNKIISPWSGILYLMTKKSHPQKEVYWFIIITRTCRRPHCQVRTYKALRQSLLSDMVHRRVLVGAACAVALADAFAPTASFIGTNVAHAFPAM